MEDKMGYLFAANLFVWGGILVYVFSLVRRNRSLKQDLDLLKETLSKESGDE